MEKEKDMKGRERSFAGSGLVILCFVSLIFFLQIRSENIAYAYQTSGGVNWIDPLNYTKPAFSPVTVPDEATCPNKYYVNLSGGSGSTCSQASPCALSGLSGKPGTTGGPAYVYLKGSGTISLGGTLYGSAGNEIVFKPWPGATAVSTFTGPNNIESSNVRYLIFDGGPNMLFNFRGSQSCGSDGQNSNCFAINVNSNYLTFARSQMQCSIGVVVSIGRNSGNVTGTSFINNEFYNCNGRAENAAIYPGSGNYCSGDNYANNTLIRNNIFRDIYAAGIEFNTRGSSTGAIIEGNAFHNIGKGSCGGSWQCRPPIILDGPSCSGNLSNVYITNNIMWDTGSGCIWTRNASSNYIYNNVCYDYGKGSGGGGPNPQGVSGYTNGGRGTISNNIIYAPNGTNPFDGSSYTASYNLCASGKSCGSGKQNWSASTVLSTDPNNSNFMKIGANSEAKDHGTTLNDVAIDYVGFLRPQNSTYDIGAFEYGIAPMPPFINSIQ